MTSDQLKKGEIMMDEKEKKSLIELIQEAKKQIQAGAMLAIEALNATTDIITKE